MTSMKIRTSWTDENVVTEGVRIYKSDQEFDVNSKPASLVEIRDGAEFYEDFNVIEGQTYFYMLSCFLGEQEVFTECFEVIVEKNYAKLTFVSCEESSVYLSGGVVNKSFVNQIGDLLILISNSNQGYTSDTIGPPTGFSLIGKIGGAYFYGKIATSANEFVSRAFNSGGGCFLITLRPLSAITSYGIDSNVVSETKTGTASTITGLVQEFTSSIKKGFDLYAFRYSQQESTTYTPTLVIEGKEFMKKSSQFTNNMFLAGAINSSQSFGGDTYTLNNIYAPSNLITKILARVWAT